MRGIRSFSFFSSLFLVLFILLGVQSGSEVRIIDIYDRARPYTAGLGFDAVTWTLEASWLKLQQAALGTPQYMDRVAQKELVLETLRLTDQINRTREAIARLYTNPDISDPESASAELRAELRSQVARQRQLAPFAEAVVQQQLSAVLHEAGLTAGGQPIPAVLYHVTPLPMALIISPREVVRQDASVLLLPNLPIEQQQVIEEIISQRLDMSSLVVPVGGLGTYPTMVISTTHLPTLFDIVAHEWIHNHLSLAPLGVNYAATPELRTMNETTASIAGGELSALVIARFYPELSATALADSAVSWNSAPPTADTPPFDFRAEMHATRVRVDELLAQGKIEEAETYMETRRQVFWENGYAIRKLNQAYFAFYGAYADSPGGAAGQDPVGPAVRTLREQSPSLADFIRRIAVMTSFAELQQAIGATP